MFQEISNGRTHGSTDPEKTWVNLISSDLATYLPVRGPLGFGPIQFLMDMDVSKNSGTPKSSIKIIGFSMIFTIHFGVYTPIFWKHPYGAFGEGRSFQWFGNFQLPWGPGIPGSQVLGLRCPEGQETPGEKKWKKRWMVWHPNHVT